MLFPTLQYRIPTLSLHCTVWEVFLRTLASVWEEPAAAADHAGLATDVNDATRLFCPRWAGCCGQIPATGCRFQPVEAFHEAWQRNLHLRGAARTAADVLPAMQPEYQQLLHAIAVANAMSTATTLEPSTREVQEVAVLHMRPGTHHVHRH